VAVPQVLSVRGPRHASTTTVPAAELFALGSPALGPDANRILAPLAARARTWRLDVTITGYASPDGGSAPYNRALSAARARAVRSRLISLGVPAGQISRVTGSGTAAEAPGACYPGGRLDEAFCATLRRVVVALIPPPAVHA